MKVARGDHVRHRRPGSRHGVEAVAGGGRIHQPDAATNLEERPVLEQFRRVRPRIQGGARPGGPPCTRCRVEPLRRGQVWSRVATSNHEHPSARERGRRVEHAWAGHVRPSGDAARDRVVELDGGQGSSPGVRKPPGDEDPAVCHPGSRMVDAGRRQGSDAGPGIGGRVVHLGRVRGIGLGIPEATDHEHLSVREHGGGVGLAGPGHGGGRTPGSRRGVVEQRARAASGEENAAVPEQDRCATDVPWKRRGRRPGARGRVVQLCRDRGHAGDLGSPSHDEHPPIGEQRGGV